MYTILALDLDEQLQMEQKLPDELVARIYQSYAKLYLFSFVTKYLYKI